MASLRSVRKELRNEILKSVNEGEFRLPAFTGIADHLMGRQVGYEQLIRTFLASEVNSALAYLRLDGKVESIGKLWKPVDSLESGDVDKISTRRKKRLRGELKAQERLSHQYGRIEDAIVAAKMITILTDSIEKSESEQTEESAANQSKA